MYSQFMMHGQKNIKFRKDLSYKKGICVCKQSPYYILCNVYIG